MASKNSIKSNLENGFYHIYNRGVGKMEIFKDEQDYDVFLNYLKEGLSSLPDKDSVPHEIYFEDRAFKVVGRMSKNFYERLVLVCYCLMPNHIHLEIKQVEINSMKDFMHSLLIRYSMYFNKKYNRVGPVFQGRYKAVYVENEMYLLYLSKYIHLNPLEISNDLTKSKSSYSDYLGLTKTLWVNTDIILSFFNKKVSSEFKKTNSYKKFVESDESNIEIIKHMALDD